MGGRKKTWKESQAKHATTIVIYRDNDLILDDEDDTCVLH